MNESKASRTLLKSPPELWSEVSTATSLQRHMDQFGEIRITKLEPETAVAWEGEQARGTITLEMSGWGTRVSLTAEAVSTGGAADEPPPEEAGQPDNEPLDRVEPVEPEPAENLDPPRETDVEMPDPTISLERDPLDASMQKPRWAQRVARALRRWFTAAPQKDADSIIRPAAAAPAPAPPTTFLAAPAPAPEPDPPEPAAASTSAAALDATLDSLGQAHHRPFSRA